MLALLPVTMWHDLIACIATNDNVIWPSRTQVCFAIGDDVTWPNFKNACIATHRRTGRVVRGGGSWPHKIRAATTCIRAKGDTSVWLTVSPNGTSIHLPDIHFGWGNKGDVHRVLLYDRQKIGTAIVHYYLFLPGGAAWKQFVFAIRAKLGVWPLQMDVGPYAYVATNDNMTWPSQTHASTVTGDNVTWPNHTHTHARTHTH